MGYQTKNHSSGDKLTIGGVLEIVGEGQIVKDGVPVEFGSGSAGIADGSISTSKLADGVITLAKLGTDTTKSLHGKLTAKKAAAQADSTATDVAGIVTDFNELLAKLRAAGIMS